MEKCESRNALAIWMWKMLANPCVSTFDFDLRDLSYISLPHVIHNPTRCHPFHWKKCLWYHYIKSFCNAHNHSFIITYNAWLTHLDVDRIQCFWLVSAISCSLAHHFCLLQWNVVFFLLKWPNHVVLAIPEFHVGIPCLCDSSTAPQTLHRSNAHELRSEWPMGGAGRQEGHLSDGRRGAARPGRVPERWHHVTTVVGCWICWMGNERGFSLDIYICVYICIYIYVYIYICIYIYMYIYICILFTPTYIEWYTLDINYNGIISWIIMAYKGIWLHIVLYNFWEQLTSWLVVSNVVHAQPYFNHRTGWWSL